MSGSIFAMKRSVLFYMCFLVWFIINGILYMAIPQSVLFFGINHWRSVPADILFTGITYFGNGIVIVPIGILCILFKKRNMGIGIIFSFIISGLVTLLLKQGFNLPRPATFFTDPSLVRTASWMTLFHKHSFPSGHATAVFAAATTICLFLPRKKWLAFLCFLIAILTVYSRVYLGEHFVEDVWVGSLVGVVFGTVSFIIQYKLFRYLRKREIVKLERMTSRKAQT